AISNTATAPSKHLRKSDITVGWLRCEVVGCGAASRRDRRPRFWILRQCVCDLVPRRPRSDVGVKLRSDAGVAVERPHANRDLGAVWPGAAEEARAAGGAERLDRTLTLAKNANQVGALKQAELLALDASLRQSERAGVLPAARAMTMAGPDERRIDLEANPAAQATSTDRLGHGELLPVASATGARRTRETTAIGRCGRRRR